MESQDPHDKLHQRPSTSSFLSHEVEMVASLRLGPPPCSCSSTEEIDERPLVLKNQIMMVDKDLNSLGNSKVNYILYLHIQMNFFTGKIFI